MALSNTHLIDWSIIEQICDSNEINALHTLEVDLVFDPIAFRDSHSGRWPTIGSIFTWVNAAGSMTYENEGGEVVILNGTLLHADSWDFVSKRTLEAIGCEYYERAFGRKLLA